ncbi:Protoporphyrinogen oxidase [Novosphingobium sp. CF614]|uniref:FAD-dependent oxidoreductase n=1 Tax=Novosphingobium sp. CF614 TaxID=1884364 RepID=UPI0008E58E65|nr:FAD-dependent oxidoreductase [Novosphingobium sp. CF614]SFF86733.1 Protoporphyrinogen oxidase [Novosphingobium sp. CF614]
MADRIPAQRGGPGPGGLVVVLGGGIAGLAAADRLSQAGWRVRIVEKDRRCGGVHRARQIGPYTFGVGSIFYEENARLFDLAPGLRNLCPTVMRVQRRIAPDGAILHYPLEPREFLRQSPLRLARSVVDLAWSRLWVRRDGTLDAIARQRLGGSFFESTGLASYISRFHHVSPREIDEVFFFRRMAYVERFTRIGALARSAARSLLSRAPVNQRTRRPLRVRPREGFEPIFERIERRLAASGVEFSLGDALLSLRREGGLFHLRTASGSCFAEAVVSTIPLDSLHQAMFGVGSGLVSLDMTTLFVSAAHLDRRLGNVLFNFHPRGQWKRATIYSRIYPDAAGRDGGFDREFLAVETTIPPGGSHDPQRIFEDFRKHMTVLGLARDLTLEGHERVENCYPLYTPGSGAILEQALHRISRSGIILAGRQGRFEYLPTSSGVILRVMQELDAAGLFAAAPEMAA